MSLSRFTTTVVPSSSTALYALAAGDSKKTHVGGDPKKLSCCGGGGDHHLPKKPGGSPSATSLSCFTTTVVPSSSTALYALAAEDGKKTHVGDDPKKLSCCGGGGDHHLPKKPGGGPSAVKLALASFLGVIVLHAMDVSLTGASAGAHRRLRHQYRNYLGGSRAKNASLSWLSVPDPFNFTKDLLARWLTPGGSPCRDARTTNISIPVLDDAVAAGAVTKLGVAEIHEFTFWALDDAGQQSCLGGDFFEIDLSGKAWKSRPPVVDHGAVPGRRR